MKSNLRILAEAIGPAAEPGWEKIEIDGVSEDSRQIRPGFLFVAIRGFIEDGRGYIDDALSRGAAAVVVEGVAPPLPVPCIRVGNARAALASLSAALFADPTQKLFTVGVTGTNGKTTVCHLSTHLLGEERTVLVSTVANEARNLHAVTTPGSPLIQQISREAVDAGKENLVLETSSAALILNRVDRVDFDAAVFTNISHDHLDLHKDMEAYLKAKLLLFQGLKPEATAIVNADDPAADRVLAANTGRLLTYAVHGDADLRAEDIRCELQKTAFTLRIDSKALPIELHLPGRHNVYNALAAAAVGMVGGIPLVTIAARLKTAQSVDGRYQFFRAKNGATVIVDFAHSPDALEKMLASLRPHCNSLISLFGCSGESDRKKRPLMGAVSGRLADMTILTDDNPKREDPGAIIAEIEAGIIPTGGSYEKIADRQEAIRRAIDLVKEKDILLIAGKGHEPYQIIGREFVPYNDAVFLCETKLAE